MPFPMRVFLILLFTVTACEIRNKPLSKTPFNDEGGTPYSLTDLHTKGVATIAVVGISNCGYSQRAIMALDSALRKKPKDKVVGFVFYQGAAPKEFLISPQEDSPLIFVNLDQTQDVNLAVVKSLGRTGEVFYIDLTEKYDQVNTLGSSKDQIEKKIEEALAAIK